MDLERMRMSSSGGAGFLCRFSLEKFGSLMRMIRCTAVIGP